jgi:shikimate kinase
VAELLGSPWADLDARVVERAGKSIASIFTEEGEKQFRRLEREVLAELLAEPPQVIATGAGWAVQPGNLESVAGNSLVIHLQVDPVVAARRLAGVADRPLLTGDLAARLGEQLAEREPWYSRADLVIAAGAGAPEVIAAGIAVAARQYGGWASR